MNIQAWLQLNSKIEFTECFWMHYTHDKHKPQMTCPTGRLNVFNNHHTLPFQAHRTMRQLNSNNICLNRSWEMARWMPGDIVCAVCTQRVLKANIQTNKKDLNEIKWVNIGCFAFQVTENSPLAWVRSWSTGSCGVAKACSLIFSFLLSVVMTSKQGPPTWQQNSFQQRELSFLSHSVWKRTQVLSLMDLNRVTCLFLSLRPEG